MSKHTESVTTSLPATGVAAGGKALTMAILMDVKMPRMNSLDATRQIRHLPRCATVSIIGLTAHAYAEDRDRGLAVGMNDYQANPIESERLFDTLMKTLGAAI